VRPFVSGGGVEERGNVCERNKNEKEKKKKKKKKKKKEKKNKG
jgi:hypothetical protein